MTIVDGDMRAVLGTASALAREPVPTFGDVLAALRELIACDSVSFNDMTLASGDFRHVIEPVSLETLADRLKPAYERLAHQHPVILAALAQPLGGATRFCDVPGGDAITETDLFREFYAPFGVRHQLILQLPAPPDVIVGYALNRSEAGGEFSDRDVAVLDALSAHLAMHHRRVIDLERGRAVAMEADRRNGWAVLTVRSDGVIEDTSSSSVVSSFAKDGRVPPEVVAVLPRTAEPDVRVTTHHLAVGGDRWRCIVHPVAMGPSVVLVRRISDERPEATPLVDLGLTPRQTEVAMALARTGGTNIQLSRTLGIAEGTIKKHLESVFRALGVDSRAAAVASLHALIG